MDGVVRSAQFNWVLYLGLSHGPNQGVGRAIFILEGGFGAEFSSLLFVLELRLCFLANCQSGLP